ncbi:glycine--tRNA ligase subunit beta [Polynucleobacter sp. 30F-ANTBAC]|uniref:glycine--tRNA ligase subunit beta n=1 Tax=Polynucleobacter sp. 30F-ANTBAC TaxID=2689095 RepID=UPI001C0B95CC|nr:glycine--tRNA ligase subunit beta [Polynucleobacter sp. 30F-ANTBAC]MBU3600246.1 glycine--tRNA ligase subunit beta [Polynucleobacter sp. 30F-ANTBAC]
MNQAPLLLELLTEELPPKALKKLGQSFSEGITQSLKSQGLLSDASVTTSFATPRRLAVHISEVLVKAPDRRAQEKLLPVSIALDSAGQATAPLLKKLASLGYPDTPISALERQGTDKAETFYLTVDVPGVELSKGLQTAIELTISKLPIPKVMRYQIAPGTEQVQDVEFVRPAHGLLALHGSNLIAVKALGLDSGNTTQGHRFLSSGSIKIEHADQYLETLRNSGKVLASFDERLQTMRAALTNASQGKQVLMPESLLEEVCSLVEWPVVYTCQFEEEYLTVPQECLILTMQTNQKYFAMTDANGKLSHQFLIVSNIETKTPEAIISGNERVVRPRLADAKFFYEQDRKKSLIDRTALLSKVVYHNKLGTQLERTERVTKIASLIAHQLKTSQPNVDISLAERAAKLAKADLLTDMVGEFPELQGVMGRYYALNDKEHPDVAAACMEHYAPRFAGDALPQTDTGTILALADKLETLVGIWGIGLAPTGEKDPFALRRHALGICRILLEKKLPLNIRQLIQGALDQFDQAEVKENAKLDLIHQFILDRLRAYLKDQSLDGKAYSTNEVESVVSQDPQVFDDVLERLEAVRRFSSLDAAPVLAAANKRIGNILKKVDFEIPKAVDQKLLAVEAEVSLAKALDAILPSVTQAFEQGHFTDALQAFATLRDDIDRFFNDVMVMDPDAALRNNRLALLSNLHSLMNRVADIGKLAS